MEFKIATWNINSINKRINHLINFINQYEPDVICLQELKCETSKFPYELLKHLPYYLYINGEKAYNGVAILSKIIANEVKTSFINNPVPNQARFVEVSFNTFMGFSRIISLYVPNGGSIGSDKFQIKLKFLEEFTNYIKLLSSYDKKLFIGGDYNVAPFDIDSHDSFISEDTTCCTSIEKDKMRIILNHDFVVICCDYAHF